VDKSLGAFSIRDLTIFQTIIMTLEQDQISVSDALKYASGLVSMPPNILKRCAECGRLMGLMAVNRPKGVNSEWKCQGCGRTEKSRKTVMQQIAKVRKRYVPGDYEHDQWVSAYNVLVAPSPLLVSPCPECEKKWGLYPIEIPKGIANVHGYQCVWQCLHCGWEEYSTRNLKEEATTLRRI